VVAGLPVRQRITFSQRPLNGYDVSHRANMGHKGGGKTPGSVKTRIEHMDEQHESRG
jgi:hypothetical protein